ncbi:MAG: hypothetical protein GQ583_08155 [Methyloprofundus sp.]|nr:hypothetical protein [Methyloprofundus sp.]
MNKISLLTIIASSFVINNALAIEPVYEGEEGIRAQVFASNCLACHSSENTGEARNNAPLGVDFDNYADAVTSGDKAVARGVTFMNMPPDFSPLSKLNEEQKQALKNWQALGFPEYTLPAIFSFSTTTLHLPKVYLKDENGDITQKVSAEMVLLPNQQAIQFELSDFHDITDSEEQDHAHE